MPRKRQPRKRPPQRNRLAELLGERPDLSQSEVARQLGVDPSRVSRWAANKSGIPDQHKAHLAEIFKCSVTFLMGWDNGNGGDADDGRERAA